MDYTFIFEHIPMYIDAAKLTVYISFIGILISIFIGLFCSLITYYKVPIIKNVVLIYIELSRNTPLLVQLFFLYFGLPKIGIVLSSKACAIIGLSFLGGSYMSESFRSGLDSIDKTQIESAQSIGLNNLQIIRYIILPQTFVISIPPLCTNVIFLVKETSVFSVVAIADLMYVAKDLIGIYYKTTEALFMLVIAYLIILLPISILATLLERRVRYAEFGD